MKISHDIILDLTEKELVLDIINNGLFDIMKNIMKNSVIDGIMERIKELEPKIKYTVYDETIGITIWSEDIKAFNMVKAILERYEK